MHVGYMGDITFKVSAFFVRTFDNYSRDMQGRWAKHDIQGALPKLEFLGPELQEVKFDIILEASLGVNPKNEIKKLKKMIETGEAFPVVIGGEPLSNELWVLKSVSQTVEFWDSHGRAISAKASVNLQEYVRGVNTNDSTTTPQY